MVTQGNGASHVLFSGRRARPWMMMCLFTTTGFCQSALSTRISKSVSEANEVNEFVEAGNCVIPSKEVHLSHIARNMIHAKHFSSFPVGFPFSFNVSVPLSFTVDRVESIIAKAQEQVQPQLVTICEEKYAGDDEEAEECAVGLSRQLDQGILRLCAAPQLETFQQHCTPAINGEIMAPALDMNATWYKILHQVKTLIRPLQQRFVQA